MRQVGEARFDQDESGGLDYLKAWTQQSAGDVLERQIAKISEAMASVLQNPPLAGQNISEWAKQQACRRAALEAQVETVKGFDDWVISNEDKRAGKRGRRATGVIDRGLDW